MSLQQAHVAPCSNSVDGSTVVAVKKTIKLIMLVLYRQTLL